MDFSSCKFLETSLVIYMLHTFVKFLTISDIASDAQKTDFFVQDLCLDANGYCYVTIQKK